MISKSIITSIALCAVYNLFCVKILPNFAQFSLSQSRWHQNLINAPLEDNLISTEIFLHEYDANKGYNCILGTSLCARLDDKIIGDNNFLLGVRGGGVNDGLEILTHKENLPDTLFVETNFLDRSNKEFLQTFHDNNFTFYIKSFFPCFRIKNAPLKVLSDALSIVNLGNYNPIALKGVGDFPQVKEILMNRFNSTSSNEIIINNIRGTVNKLLELKKKGVKIVFFYIPQNCELQNTNIPKLNATLSDSLANLHGIIKIANVDCSQYHHSDGNQLDKNSATKYSVYFANQIRLLNRN